MGASDSVTSVRYDTSLNYDSEESFSSKDALANGSEDGSARLTPSEEVDANGQPTHYEGGFVTNGIKTGSQSDKNLEAAGNFADDHGIREVKYKVSAANTNPIVSALQDQGYIPNTPVNSVGQVSSAVLESALDDGLLVWNGGELVVSSNYEPGEVFMDVPVETAFETQGQTNSGETSSSDTATSTGTGESAADLSNSTDSGVETRLLKVNGQSGDHVFSRDQAGNVSVKDGRGEDHQLTDEQLEGADLTRRSTFEDIGTAIEKGRITLGVPDTEEAGSTVPEEDGATGTEGVSAPIYEEAQLGSSGHKIIKAGSPSGSVIYNEKTAHGYSISEPALNAVGLNGNASAAEISTKFKTGELSFNLEDGGVRASVVKVDDQNGFPVTVSEVNRANRQEGFKIRLGERSETEFHLSTAVYVDAGLNADSTAADVAEKIKSGVIAFNNDVNHPAWVLGGGV